MKYIMTHAFTHFVSAVFLSPDTDLTFLLCVCVSGNAKHAVSFLLSAPSLKETLRVGYDKFKTVAAYTLSEPIVSATQWQTNFLLCHQCIWWVCHS